MSTDDRTAEVVAPLHASEAEVVPPSPPSSPDLKDPQIYDVRFLSADELQSARRAERRLEEILGGRRLP